MTKAWRIRSLSTSVVPRDLRAMLATRVLKALRAILAIQAPKVQPEPQP